MLRGSHTLSPATTVRQTLTAPGGCLGCFSFLVRSKHRQKRSTATTPPRHLSPAIALKNRKMWLFKRSRESVSSSSPEAGAVGATSGPVQEPPPTTPVMAASAEPSQPIAIKHPAVAKLLAFDADGDLTGPQVQQQHRLRRTSSYAGPGLLPPTSPALPGSLSTLADGTLDSLLGLGESSSSGSNFGRRRVSFARFPDTCVEYRPTQPPMLLGTPPQSPNSEITLATVSPAPSPSQADLTASRRTSSLSMSPATAAPYPRKSSLASSVSTLREEPKPEHPPQPQTPPKPLWREDPELDDKFGIYVVEGPMTYEEHMARCARWPAYAAEDARRRAERDQEKVEELAREIRERQRRNLAEARAKDIKRVRKDRREDAYLATVSSLPQPEGQDPREGLERQPSRAKLWIAALLGAGGVPPMFPM
ncbi:hypothetical protein DFJ77DRAFT_445206 [Powellomyces hirtus]|nr:hypothetical protein DFJ77DRAFT_445206 [Powellomyces hirtus]